MPPPRPPPPRQPPPRPPPPRRPPRPPSTSLCCRSCRRSSRGSTRATRCTPSVSARCARSPSTRCPFCTPPSPHLPPPSFRLVSPAFLCRCAPPPTRSPAARRAWMAWSAPLYSLETCVSPLCRVGCRAALETPTTGRPLLVVKSSSSCWQPTTSLSRQNHASPALLTPHTNPSTLSPRAPAPPSTLSAASESTRAPSPLPHHLLTCSFAHLLTYSLTHLLTYSLTHRARAPSLPRSCRTAAGATHRGRRKPSCRHA